MNRVAIKIGFFFVGTLCTSFAAVDTLPLTWRGPLGAVGLTCAAMYGLLDRGVANMEDKNAADKEILRISNKEAEDKEIRRISDKKIMKLEEIKAGAPENIDINTTRK